MDEDYVARRRAYIAQVRSELSQNDSVIGQNAQQMNTKEEQERISHAKWARARFFLALFLFGVYLLCDYTGISLQGMSSSEIVQILKENTQVDTDNLMKSVETLRGLW